MDSKTIENVNELKRGISYIKEEINSIDSLLYAMNEEENLNINYFEIFMQNNLMKDIVGFTNQYLSEITNNRYLLKFNSEVDNPDVFEIKVFDKNSSTLNDLNQI